MKWFNCINKIMSRYLNTKTDELQNCLKQEQKCEHYVHDGQDVRK